MLNPFPDLLTYGLLAPFILRVGAALVLAWMMALQWRRRDEINDTRFVLIGKGAWILWLALIVECAAGAGLLLGFYTQWAAILGAIIGVKGMVWSRRYHAILPLSLPANFLLLFVCLSLLLSGAGAFALDIPL